MGEELLRGVGLTRLSRVAILTVVVIGWTGSAATGALQVANPRGAFCLRGVAETRPELRYAAEINEAAARFGLRPEVVRAVIRVESAFVPHAVSRKGARGLMQLMPDTAAQFGVTNPYDPAENIRAGVAYLRQLLTRYQGDEELALAAYNAGPAAASATATESHLIARRVTTSARSGPARASEASRAP